MNRQARGHVLQEGDVFKLGRFKLRVRQMVPGPSSVPGSPSQLNDSAASSSYMNLHVLPPCIFVDERVGVDIG